MQSKKRNIVKSHRNHVSQNDSGKVLEYRRIFYCVNTIV